METDQPHEAKEEFLAFLADGNNPDYRAVFRQVEKLPPLPSQILHEDISYRVHPVGENFLRSFFDAPRHQKPYGVAVREDRMIRVDYLEEGAHCVSQMHNSFFHLGFESLLLREGRLCLHAAAVSTHLGGILFSGQSGVGKSTQAELWCRCRNAKLINGDRPILARQGSEWLAWGSPYAGSSRCHINENCPVMAIVMLRQEKNCSLRRLEAPEAFRAVWSGLTMNSWDEKQVAAAVDLALQLIETVPVFEYGCTPDEKAVTYLEKELQTLWNK